MIAIRAVESSQTHSSGFRAGLNFHF